MLKKDIFLLKLCLILCGLLKPKSRFITILVQIFILLFLIGCIDSNILLIVNTISDKYDIRVCCALSISFILQILTWYSLRTKNSDIIQILKYVKKLSKIKNWKTKSNFKLIVVKYIILILPYLYFTKISISVTNKFIEDYTPYLMYGYNIENKSLRIFLCLTKVFIDYCITLNFATIMIVIYLTNCNFIATFLSKYSNDMETAFITSTFILRHEEFSKNYLQLYTAAKLMQKTFFLSSFYQCLSQIFLNFSSIALFFAGSHSLISETSVNSQLMKVFISYAALNILSLFAVFYCASEIPSKMKMIKESFCEEYVNFCLSSKNELKKSKLSILKELMDLPEVVLTGFDVIVFTKAKFFSLLGVFATFGLLFATIEHQ